jgi:DNA-binding NarL/FixJ family response regulator
MVVGEVVRVLITDDHAVVREGIASALRNEPDIEIVAQACDGREAITKAVELKPDVVIMDISMPNCGGLEATSALVHKLPDTKILILTVSEREEDLFQAVRFGARGYLLKSTPIEEIKLAVRQVASGEAILSPHIAARLLDEFRGAPKPEAQLSSREMEVLKLVGAGLTNREIAERLVVAPDTAKTYLQRIMHKLHLGNRAEAIAYALKRGLIEPPVA